MGSMGVGLWVGECYKGREGNCCEGVGGEEIKLKRQGVRIVSEGKGGGEGVKGGEGEISVRR